MEISCACVRFYYTTSRCCFVGNLSTCSGVIKAVCVPGGKDEGVGFVNLARPKWLGVNAQRLETGFQNSPPAIDVTQ